MVVITKQELKNLGRTYGYHCTDKSIAGPLMQKYWNWAIQFIPWRWHPNLVTYTGFLWLLSSVGMVFYFDYTNPEKEVLSTSITVPSIVWFWTGLSIFMYQTFDALDGKQARRIKAGSPAGEIVDHSADAVTTIFVQYLLCSAIFRNSPIRVFILTLLVFVGFFSAHWEHYVTKIFYLGYISGPTEGLLLISVLFFLTGTFGHSVWSDPNYYYFPNIYLSVPNSIAQHLHPQLANLSMTTNADFVFYFTLISGLLTVIPSVFKTLYHAITLHLRENRGFLLSPTLLHPKVSFYEAIIPTATPYFFLCFIACDYVYTFGHFHRYHFFLLEVALGWVTALMATRITVRRLTGARYGFATVSFVATFVGLVLPLIAFRGAAILENRLDNSSSYRYSILSSLLSSDLLQWFNVEVNQQKMWIWISLAGGFEYIFYCWRLLMLMAEHLGVNLLVLTPAQLAIAKQIEQEHKLMKKKAQ